MPKFEENPRTASPEIALSTIEGIYDTWRGSYMTLSADENIRFAYHFGRWIYDLYGKEVLEFNYGEFDGSEAPDSLKPLLTHPYGSDGFLSGENTARIVLKPELDYTPAFVPRWEELHDISPFQEMLRQVSEDPSIYSKIKLAKVLIHDNVLVEFEPHFAKGWGIQFMVNPGNISVYPYGEKGKTQQPVNYMVGYSEKPNVLAQTVAQLIMLCVKHAKFTGTDSVNSELLESFVPRLMGDLPLPIDPNATKDFDHPPREAIKSLLIRELIELGLIEPSD